MNMNTAFAEVTKAIVNTSATKIEPPKAVLTGRTVHIGRLYLTDSLPKVLKFKKVEKLFWENDIQGVNNLIHSLINKRDDVRKDSVYALNSVIRLSLAGISIPTNCHRISILDILSIHEYDVFIAFDEDGDLVRAEL